MSHIDRLPLEWPKPARGYRHYAERGESVEEASLKRSYKDTNSYQLVFKDKNGKVQSTLNFDSKEKAEKQKKVRSKRLKPQDGSYEIYQVKG